MSSYQEVSHLTFKYNKGKRLIASPDTNGKKIDQCKIKSLRDFSVSNAYRNAQKGLGLFFGSKNKKLPLNGDLNLA